MNENSKDQRILDLENRIKELENKLSKFSNFEDIVNSIPTPLFVKDKELRYTLCNNAFSEYIGLSKKELYGKTVFEIAPNPLSEKYHESDLKFKNGTVNKESYEAQVKCYDNTLRDILFHKAAIKENNEFEGIIGVMFDITDRKITEQALKESEEKFRLLFENMNSGFAILELGTDWQATFVLVNQKFKEIFKKQTIEFIGLTAKEIFADRDLSYYNNYVSELIRNGSVNFELYNDQIQKYLHVSLFISQKNRFGILVTDITAHKLAQQALKEGEEKISLLMNSTAEGIYGIDTNGVCTYVNKTCLDLLGYTTEKELLGNNIHKIIHHTHANGSKLYARDCKIYKSMLSKVGTHATDEYFWRADGSSFPVEYHSYPQFKNNDVVGAVVTFTNITHRLQTEKMLKESEAKYKMLSDLSGDLIVMHRNFRKFYVNPAVESILGYSQQEYLTFGSLDLVHADDLDMIRTCIQHDMQKKTIKNAVVDFRMKHKNGHYVWISAHRILHKVDDFYFTIVNGRDITKQKEAELQLKRLSVTVDQSPAAIVITDLKGNIEYTNPEFTNITGYTLKEVKGMNPRFLNSGFHPREFYANLWSTICSGKIWKGEIYNKHKNGTYFWEESIISPILDNNNAIMNFVAVKQDITKRKKIEMKLLRSKENLKEAQMVGNVGHWDYNIIEDKLYWSEQTYRIYEVNPGEFDCTFNNVVEMFHPDEKDLVVKAYKKSVDKKIQFEVTHRIITKTGRIKYITQRASTKYHENGNALSTLGSVQDVTNLKEKEIQLRELIGTKDKFFSIISHDLKNPFNTIIGFLDMILNNYEKLDDEKKLFYLKLINTTSKNTYSLLDNLLTWAKSQQGKITLNISQIKLTDLVSEICTLLNEAAANKKIKIVNNIKSEIHVFADLNMISTVFRNIVTNAIKYTKEGGTISLSSERTGKFLKITVSDTGIGMTEAVRGTLFRIEKTKSMEGTKGERGTGLGLILCKEFIEKHGGNISVESEPGKGSSFIFTLPCNEV